MRRYLFAGILLWALCGGKTFGQSAAACSRPIYKEDPKADSIASLRAAEVADSLKTAKARISDSLYLASSGQCPLPDTITQLLKEHRTDEALEAYEAYREGLTNPTPFGLAYLHKEFIGKLATWDTTSKQDRYSKLNRKLEKELRRQYPHKAEVIWYDTRKIKGKDFLESMVALLTKMIDNDPANLWPYKERGRYLYILGRYAEALADFERLPDKETLVEYHNCCMFLGKY